MAVATKNRRKLKHKERGFVWFVVPDKDSSDSILHVVSDDKRFLVHYVLGQRADQALIIVLGSEFAGASIAGNHTRFRCPRFDESAIATPSVVVRLIDWCLTATDPREALPWGEFPYHSYGGRPEDRKETEPNPEGSVERSRHRTLDEQARQE